MPKKYVEKYAWILATLKLNWRNAVMEPKTFYTMMFFMCIQNFIYFGLWVILFSQISSLRGWGLREVAFLYGAGAIGYGILFTIFGGLNQLGTAIHNGELDVYLSRPQSPVLMALLQRIRTDSMGDILTGVLMLGHFVRPTLDMMPLVILLCVSMGFIYFSVRLIGHCLTFWGLGQEVGENGFMAFLIASTNPQKGFPPIAKAALLSIFPAGYIALIPVEIMLEFRWDYLALQLGASCAITAFSFWLFYTGLKRYSSGNKFIVLR